MKIAIIEDEPIHAELLAGYLEQWSSRKRIPVRIMQYSSAESFLFEWETEQDFSALFVDIQMKNMNGMEMAKQVRKKDGNISIIFTTGIADYMEEGYEVEALHYLIKPISQEKVGECMDKVLERNDSTHHVLVHSQDEVYKLVAEEINYIEARGHGCVIEIVTGNIGQAETELIEVTESISALEEQMGAYGFIKCHRSYLCGIRNIHHIGKTEVTFDNGSRIPVSRRLHREVNQAFIRYFRKP